MESGKVLNRLGLLVIALSPLLLLSCGSKWELPVVKQVDLGKYSGKWYDIAHLPQRFQAGCKCVTAEYTPEEKYVKVLNTCVEQKNDEVRTVEGKAFPVDGSNNAQLKVQFFWPFRGDYYIIALNDDYSMAMVGAPNRKYLWILSRTPVADPTQMEEYLSKARDLGFDTGALEYTDQSCQTED